MLASASARRRALSRLAGAPTARALAARPAAMSPVPPCWPQPQRFSAAAATSAPSTAQLIKRLRDATGAPMLEYKTALLAPSSARILPTGIGHCFNLPLARPARRHCNPRAHRCAFSGAISAEGRTPTTRSSLLAQSRAATGPPRRRRLSTASPAGPDVDARASEEQWARHRRSILTHALRCVHDEGWTDDAVAAGTLELGLPPAYVGRVASATSPLGSAELVAFFMDECNADLRRRLEEERPPRREGDDDAAGSASEVVAERLGTALQLRLSLVLPFVAGNRWHEGMAIGALPQNFFRTARQLETMAATVLKYAVGEENAGHPAHRVAVMAAYAAAELHLLSDGADDAVGGGSLSLSGERYRATRTFTEARAAEVARLVGGGATLPALTGLSLPDPTHLAAAAAVTSSLAGAALSLAAPSAAALAGTVLPRATASTLTSLWNLMGSPASADRRDGTRPSDYTAAADALDPESLPPFDSSEEIFPEKS